MENSWIIAALAVVGIVVVGMYGLNAKQGYNPYEQQHVLSVTGTHELEVAPDEAKVTMQVVTRASMAKDASAQNAQLMNEVMAALQAQGLAAGDVETTGVILQRWEEWSKENGTYVERGYEQTNTIRVTTHDLTKVGPAIDAAVGAGANSVTDVSFTLKPETQERYKREALTEATKTARAKATALADAAGVPLGKAVSISENSWFQPYSYNTKSVLSADMAGAAPTPISPQNVQLSVSVSMGYALA